MGSKPNITSVLIRDEDADTDETGEEGPVVLGAEACGAATSQGTLTIANNHRKYGEGHGTDSSGEECRRQQGPVDILTLDF